MRIEVLQKEIIARGGFMITQVTDGFDLYPYHIITGDRLKIHELLKKLKDFNGEENSYVDFYFELLSNDEQERIKERLSKEGKELLNQFHREGKERVGQFSIEGKGLTQALQENQKPVYFQLTDDMLKLTAELSTTEILFSSYYFCKYPVVVWTNYEGKHPIFYKDKPTQRFLSEQGIIFDMVM